MGALIAAYLDDKETGGTLKEKAKWLIGMAAPGATHKVGKMTSDKLLEFFLSDDPDAVITKT
jgi:hypothetical protein